MSIEILVVAHAHMSSVLHFNHSRLVENGWPPFLNLQEVGVPIHRKKILGGVLV